MRTLYLALLLVFASAASAADDLIGLREQLQKGLDTGDYPSVEMASTKLLERLPGYPRALYSLAEARARLGNLAGALAALNQLAAMGIHVDLGKPEFSPLAALPESKMLAARFAALLKPVGRMEPAFRLSEPDFIPEGLAYDPASGDLFVASVHLRKIVRVHAGRESPFTGQDAGLWSVLGIAVDPAHSSLWAVSDAIPQMQGYDPGLDGKTALLRIDLKTGKLLTRYAPPDSVPHAFGDLCVASDGTVYVADSYGGVFRLPAGGASLEPLTPAGALISAQGLALSADGRLLYLSDYASGLYAYELATGRLHRLNMPEQVSPYYVDGLKLHGHSLIATQNGAEPQRLVRFRLGPDGLTVSGVDVLESAQPLVPEPTLFTLVGDELYLVANAQWSRFDDKGNLAPPEKLEKPVIVRLPLAQ